MTKGNQDDQDGSMYCTRTDETDEIFESKRSSLIRKPVFFGQRSNTPMSRFAYMLPSRLGEVRKPSSRGEHQTRTYAPKKTNEKDDPESSVKCLTMNSLFNVGS